MSDLALLGRTAEAAVATLFRVSDQFGGGTKDFGEHFFREFPRRGVLIRRVIRGEQNLAVGHLVLHTVAE